MCSHQEIRKRVRSGSVISAASPFVHWAAALRLFPLDGAEAQGEWESVCKSTVEPMHGPTTPVLDSQALGGAQCVSASEEPNDNSLYMRLFHPWPNPRHLVLDNLLHTHTCTLPSIVIVPQCSSSSASYVGINSINHFSKLSAPTHFPHPSPLLTLNIHTSLLLFFTCGDTRSRVKELFSPSLSFLSCAPPSFIKRGDATDACNRSTRSFCVYCTCASCVQMLCV